MKALALFLLNFTQFFVIVANTRAYTQGNYAWTAITDMIFCTLSFTLMKRVAESKTWYEQAAYVIGGTLGAQASIYVTKLLYGA